MEDQTAQTEQQQTEATQETKIHCPCCGELTFNKHTKIQQSLMNHYIACMMTGTQFWRDYQLYDGKLRVRATIPSYSRSRQLQILLGQLKAQQATASEADNAAVIVSQLEFVLRRMLCIEQIEIRDPEGSGSRVIKRTYDVVLNTIKGGLQDAAGWAQLSKALQAAYAYVRDTNTGVSVPFVLLSSVADAHMLVYNTITSAGLDENFWQGIKLT